jgi:peptide-methionine (R)-S-oxide reductase
MVERIEKTEDEWRAILTPDQFRILRRGGTEPPFDNAYWDNHADGTYECAGCALQLFDSADKFDSGTGWPSFGKPVEPDAVEERLDSSLGMRRTEVLCARCGGHLGHVFEDGPAPTGKRYCMNSGSLKFEARQVPAAISRT